LNLLDGHEVDPAGGRSKSDWVGSASDSDWDERYWHPEAEDGGRVDLPTGHYGYPNVPGLIAAARKPFKSSGLRHPWFSVHGNHDALLQGTVAVDDALNELATGDKRIVGLAQEQTPFDAIEAIPTVGPARYIHTDDSPTQEITPNAARRLTSPGKFAELHLKSSSLPTGHGFTSKNVVDGTAHYVTQIGDLILVALDTVNHHGGFEGSITESQLRWLKSTLEKFSNQYVVIASHHPSPAIINDYQPEGTEPRVLGPEILSTLMNHKNVLVWINGHEHENQIILNVGPDGRVLPEINTASIIDWPQQARILEFSVDSESAYITSTVINHDGLVDPDLARLDLADIAGLSRILAFNDYQRRDPLTSIHRKEGSIADRNFVLRLPNLLSSAD
jgi:metallophosphoesterase (TIGR03767 family)